MENCRLVAGVSIATLVYLRPDDATSGLLWSQCLASRSCPVKAQFRCVLIGLRAQITSNTLRGGCHLSFRLVNRSRHSGSRAGLCLDMMEHRDMITLPCLLHFASLLHEGHGLKCIAQHLLECTKRATIVLHMVTRTTCQHEGLWHQKGQVMVVGTGDCELTGILPKVTGLERDVFIVVLLGGKKPDAGRPDNCVLTGQLLLARH
jgi:hypothetical protein